MRSQQAIKRDEGSVKPACEATKAVTRGTTFVVLGINL